MYATGLASGWVSEIESQYSPIDLSHLLYAPNRSSSIITPQEQGVYDAESSGITPKIEETLNYLKFLTNVEIPQPDKIRDYLTYHLDMAYLLLKTSEMARLKFRSPVQLSLELHQDPEVDDEYLTLYVRQNEYDESVMKRIKQVRKEYGKIIANLSGWFLLTTDFCPPR